MKPLALLFLTEINTNTSSLQSTVVSIVVLFAAVALVLNSLGLMPRGKTAERLKIDLDVSEKELSKERVENARLTAQLKVEQERPDYKEMVHLMIDHDKRMTEQNDLIADKLNAIHIAVIPPLGDHE